MALGIAICGGTVLVSTYVTKPCVAPARLPRLVVPAVKVQESPLCYEVDASHAITLSQPVAVADLIRSAVRVNA